MKELLHYSVGLWVLLVLGCSSGRQEAPPLSPAYNLPASGIIDQQGPAFGPLVERYESPIRTDWQQPERILAMLGDLRGQRIADIGAGTGFFSFRLVEAGASVIAIDIDPRFLEFMEQRKEGWPDSLSQRLQIRPAHPEFAPLQPQEVDGVLVVNTYSFIQDRINYFRAVRESITQNGWLLVIDYKPGSIPVGPDESQKLASEIIISELQDAGYQNVRLDSVGLPYQHMYWAKP